MSRSHREGTSGNLKQSMRDNYTEHGVDEYYKKVGGTYRNPHFPGVRNAMFIWLNKWWSHEQSRIGESGFTLFDMACGSGEATTSLMEWWMIGRRLYSSSGQAGAPNAMPRAKSNLLTAPAFGPTLTCPTIYAADPYTSSAFHARTGLYNCSELSFRDIAEGSLPQSPLSSLPPSTDAPKSPKGTQKSTGTIEMTVCSFALHLIESPSELFALLWELSTKCRWLIVLAPHKKPEIKDGWGWSKWDVDNWAEVPMTDHKGEILNTRVHCRVYRSLNVQ
ncbi:hypothetical protein BDY19DRAFT_960585 [Irpex rosettiformis]|uniref:Uncharacterized protein n=1 Tax=Irpex rosettiformis TaxID=378272 RepID=A0ACB8TX34_9APHY|nr:hypothetical protein BDY19DRAFT_960585 [Irpex rosettiformis]